MRLLVFFFLLSFISNAYAQGSDFILLKKKNKAVKIFYKSDNIEFVTTNGAYRNALITDIKNDSIYLQEFLISRVLTTIGTFIIDTVGSFRYKYYYKEIYHFDRENKKFNVAGSGGTLLGGGSLLTIASGVVYLIDKKDFSPTLLATGAGLAAVGYLMSKGSNKGITIGKKNYHLQYINAARIKK